MTGREVAAMMVNYARAYRKRADLDSIKRNSHMNEYRGEPPDQKLVDAVVVDFINFMMWHGVGMDFGLYTCDIQPDAEKKDE